MRAPMRVVRVCSSLFLKKRILSLGKEMCCRSSTLQVYWAVDIQAYSLSIVLVSVNTKHFLTYTEWGIEKLLHRPRAVSELMKVWWRIFMVLWWDCALLLAASRTREWQKPSPREKMAFGVLIVRKSETVQHQPDILVYVGWREGGHSRCTPMYSYVLLCTPMYSRNVEHLSTEMECTLMYSRVQRTYSYVLQTALQVLRLHSKYSGVRSLDSGVLRWYSRIFYIHRLLLLWYHNNNMR